MGIPWHRRGGEEYGSQVPLSHVEGKGLVEEEEDDEKGRLNHGFLMELSLFSMMIAIIIIYIIINHHPSSSLFHEVPERRSALASCNCPLMMASWTGLEETWLWRGRRRVAMLGVMYRT